MKNPWKRLSKINPQKEDGHRQISTCVLEALVKAKLTTTEMSIILTVISKTWGFNKKFDAISISQLSKATGFTSRAIQKSNKELVKKRLLIIESSKRVNRGSPLNAYMLNKHYDTWKIQDRKRVNIRTGGEQPGKKRVNSGTPTIDIITIDKELYSRVINYLNRKTGKNFKPTTKETRKLIDARTREDYQPEDFKTVIDNKVYDYTKDKFEHKYLRPQTLFGTKFESYLNQKPVNNKPLSKKEVLEKHGF